MTSIQNRPHDDFIFHLNNLCNLNYTILRNVDKYGKHNFNINTSLQNMNYSTNNNKQIETKINKHS